MRNYKNSMMGPDQLLKFLNVIAGPDDHFQQCSFGLMAIQFSFAQFIAKRKGDRLLQSTGLFDCKGNCTLNVALNGRGNSEFCSPNL